MILRGDTFPPFFVSTVTLNVLKSIKNGIINILSFFISELLSGISGVSSELLCSDFIV